MLADTLRQIRYLYGQYREADQRLRAADDWLQGARLRYRNPLPIGGDGQNWLLQYLNDYLLALRFRTDSATDAAALLASYNAQLARLEEVKGTLLNYFDIDLAYDPCRQLQRIPDLGISPESIQPAGSPPESVPAPAPTPAVPLDASIAPLGQSMR